MKTITKLFATLKQAETFLMSLYNDWQSVNCVRSPLFSEAGIYIFKVKNPISKP
jgi:hypothetical protein